MNHKPYHDSMQELLDRALRPEARAKLEEHLAVCEDCQATWAALSEVPRLFKAEPLVAPQPGFTDRFKARLERSRSRPRLIWGAVALGLGAVAASALVIPVGVGLIWSAVRAAQQPATTLALYNGFNAASGFADTVLDALFIAVRALAEGALDNPLALAAGAVGLALTGVWLLLVRKLLPEGLT